MSTEQEIKIPDIGTDAAVDVIEISVKVGDSFKAEDPIITLESEKASMDVPAPLAGVVKAMKVKVGDKVRQGDVILLAETKTPKTESAKSSAATETKAPADEFTKSSSTQAESTTTSTTPLEKEAVEEKETTSEEEGELYASPAVRRLARELGVELSQIVGTGRKGRIQLEDLHQYVKPVIQQFQSGEQFGSSSGFALPQVPEVDHSKFGEIEEKPLTKIQKISGPSLQRNWIVVPHVTQFDEADITHLEAFRKSQHEIHKAKGLRITLLPFIMKAVAAGLKAYPKFNSSLSANGESLIYKKYCHIGVAVDTPNGLVVAVIRDVDKKGIIELSEELMAISEKARTKGLSIADMQGSSFTISSLGGIGGTAFTPIVNLPDVAILGVSRSQIKPVYQNEQFVPRLMLPLSLSYDHRVIDGADGARFSKFLVETLSDICRLVL